MSRGFSLVEVLVALVILSVGLLGSAVLLLDGLRDQALASRQEAALGLVADIADRIRSNPLARGAYDTDTAPLTAGSCEDAASCDPAALAAHDLLAFRSAASALLLPHRPIASIHFEPAIGTAATDRYVISLSWHDARDPGAADEITLTLLAQPVAGTA